MNGNYLNLFSLEGKVALITGGYGYLGKAISLGLAAAGAHVYVLGKSREKFDLAFGMAEQQPVFFQHCDIASTDSIAQAYKHVQEKEQQLDILINNAFYSAGQQPEALTDEQWAHGIDGSLNSTYRCIREIIPYMKSQGNGKVINVASMYGMVSPDFTIYNETPGSLNPPHYGAAKAGVIQLTKYFACYLGKYGIRVNTVSPGPFPSQAVKQNKVFVNELQKKNPLNRIGQPEELVGAFVYLASDASSYVTGHNLVVDGGWTAW